MVAFSQQCEEIWNTDIFSIPSLWWTLYKLSWADTIIEIGFLRTSDQCLHSMNPCSPLWPHHSFNIRERREQTAWVPGEVSRWPWIIVWAHEDTGNHGGASGHCLLCGVHFWDFITSRTELFCLRCIDSSWEKVKSSALNNLKDRVFCICSFPVVYEKKYQRHGKIAWT